FVAIREGEVAILDAGGNEIVRHRAGGFLGELNLLSGQTVFLTAVVRQALRYIAVERDALRAMLFEDGPLSNLLLSTFIARREAFDACSREHGALRTGRSIAQDRELPRLPGRHHRDRAHESRGYASAKVQRPYGDAVPGGFAGSGERTPRGAAGRGSRDPCAN